LVALGLNNLELNNLWVEQSWGRASWNNLGKRIDGYRLSVLPYLT
jgi:hypothetical protein